MKKEYLAPSIEVVKLSNEDVITTSTNVNCPNDWLPLPNAPRV